MELERTNQSMAIPIPRLSASPILDTTSIGLVSEPSDGPVSPGGPPHRLPPRRGPPPPGPGPTAGTSVFPARLFNRPSSVLVYGSCRPLVNLTLFALATTTNPDLEWVELGEPKEDRTLLDPVQLGWIPEDRLWRVNDLGALQPTALSQNLSLVGTIRADEPPETLAQITEFLRLPDRSQRILATRPPDGRPGVVAVTDTHRAERAFSANRVPSILTVHRNAGFSVFIGHADSPGPGRNLFDFVFHLNGENEDAADWKKRELVCERGISSGPLREARPVLLEDIPIVAHVLFRATSSEPKRTSS
jgi:hypothetical protein